MLNLLMKRYCLYYPICLGQYYKVVLKNVVGDGIYNQNSIIKKYFLKMIIISFVWFLWHIPIYRLSWITAGSSNYLIFYLMILGNTFTFGAIKEYSRGVLLCVIAHIFIDSFAVLMLVQSNIIPIVILVIIEIVIFVL